MAAPPDYITAVWKSKTFLFPNTVSPACARVVCRRLRQNGTYDKHGLVRIEIYGVRFGVWQTPHDVLVDETILLATADVISGVPSDHQFQEHRSQPFRIPSNGLYDAVRFELTLEGPVEVEGVEIAESMEELGAK